METSQDRYQGFLLDAYPSRVPSRRAAACVVWARDKTGEPVFGIKLVITDAYARRALGRATATDEISTHLAIRYAHGLIDTENWEPAEDAVEVLRSSDWDQSRNEGDWIDDDLRRHLLSVFARMARVAPTVDYAPRLDVDGYADVVGVKAERVRSLLNELATRLWIEPYAYSKQPSEGNARITAAGYQRLDEIAAAPQIESDLSAVARAVAEYVNGAEFRNGFPGAWRSLQHAIELLADVPLKAGIVGYTCREAMQTFATEAVRIRGIRDAPPPEQVTNRIRAIAAKEHVGEKTTDFLEALVNYWSKTYDLTQRQAKNAMREGEELTDEDARRVVFHTAMVMYEVSRLPVEEGRDKAGDTIPR